MSPTTLLLQNREKLVTGYLRLSQNALQSSNRHDLMLGNDAANRTLKRFLPHDNMAASLAHRNESQAFKGANYLVAGKLAQFRQ